MRRSAARLLLVLAVTALAPGCSLLPKKSIQNSVAAAPNEPWTPPAAAAMPPSTAASGPQIPEEYTKPGTTLSLGQLVDVGVEEQPGDARGLVLRARGGGRGRLEALAVLSLRRGRRHPRAAETVGRRRAVHVPADDVRARRSPRPGCSSTSARGRRRSRRPRALSTPPTGRTTPRSRTSCSRWRRRTTST